MQRRHERKPNNLRVSEIIDSESSVSFRKRLSQTKRRLDDRFGHISFFAQFAVVGATGTFVNLMVVSIFHTFLEWGAEISIALGILVSLTTNFFLNRWITFSYAKERPWILQYFKYVAACSVGVFANYVTAISVLPMSPVFESWPQIPAAIGVLAGVMFNFVISRFWVFRKHSA